MLLEPDSLSWAGGWQSCFPLIPKFFAIQKCYSNDHVLVPEDLQKGQVSTEEDLCLRASGHFPRQAGQLAPGSMQRKNRPSPETHPASCKAGQESKEPHVESCRKSRNSQWLTSLCVEPRRNEVAGSWSPSCPERAPQPRPSAANTFSLTGGWKSSALAAGNKNTQ